jgi:hypothetical protein
MRFLQSLALTPSPTPHPPCYARRPRPQGESEDGWPCYAPRSFPQGERLNTEKRSLPMSHFDTGSNEITKR